MHGSEARADSPQILNLWGIILAMFFWGATVGAFLIAPVSEKLGRKNGLIVSFATQVLAVGLVFFSFVVRVLLFCKCAPPNFGTSTIIAILL